MSKNQVQAVNRDYALLAPFFANALKLAIKECQDEGYPIELFEGYRSPERQNYLWEQGRTREGKIVTHSSAWNSWHQYGLAADLVGKINGKWDWSLDYDRIEQIMKEHGFESLKFERVHFQMTGGMKIKTAREIAEKHGVQIVWQKVVELSKLDS
jgi:peptidoglycan L-alanyl-D-glutamate endopeptidase CwlK